MLEPLTGKFEGINWAFHCEKFASFLLLKQAILSSDVILQYLANSFVPQRMTVNPSNEPVTRRTRRA